MSRLAQGDTSAMGALYQRHAPLAKRALGRMLPEASAAELEELLQDVFVALHDSAPRYPLEAGMRRWIWGISAKTALFWRRKTWVRRTLLRRHQIVSLGMARPASTSPELAILLRQEIANAVGKLPQEQRDVLLLHAVEGFSGDEIAGLLGLRHETVRTRLFRARQRLIDDVSPRALSELLTEDKR
ncbi:MAG: RNA polymerase sigma factor [Deltaproteobacteria bacterium]|nr:RNA polymerase sigma factor [Deltaproteobacteria bacterium]